MAYATTAEFKAWHGITDSDEDSIIAIAIADGTAWFEGQTGRVFEAASDTVQKFDAVRDVDKDTLYFYDLDLCAITSVVNGDGVTLSALTDYMTEPRRATPYYAIKLRSGSPYWWTYDDDPEEAIVVTGRWAYSTTPPADVKQAVLDVAHQFYKQRDNMAEAAEAIGYGVPVVSQSGQLITPNGLPKSVWGAVGRYKRRV